MSTESSASRSRDADVIIVGAGPTGLTLANLLGLEGVRVLLVERNDATVQEPRAVSIDDESLRTMQAAGLLDAVMTQVVPGYGSRYLTPSGRCFLTVLPSGKPYGHPRRNAFRQPVLEAQLREGLRRFPNVESRFGWTMESFSQDDDGVAVAITREGGTQTLRAGWLVGADGASSLVRKQLGITLEGETLPERWLIVDLENSPAERDTVVFCDTRRPCIALPGPKLTRRFEFKLFQGEDEAALLAPDKVEQLLSWRGAAPESVIVRKVVYTFHARVAPRWSDRRVFLAGDAAHLTPPFAGQGMNSGIRDAHNLAWKLTAVIKARLPATLLDSYEAERRHHVGGMIDLALRMGRIMGPRNRLTGWLTQTAFRAAGLWPPLRAYFGEMKYKPKPRFREGFLLATAHPLVGSLLPQPRATNAAGAEGLLDDLLPRGFVVLGVGLARGELEEATRAAPWTRLGAPRLVLDPPAGEAGEGVLRTASAEDGLRPLAGKIVVVRPDRYVMACLSPRQADEAARQLEALLAAPQAGGAAPPKAVAYLRQIAAQATQS